MISTCLYRRSSPPTIGFTARAHLAAKLNNRPLNATTLRDVAKYSRRKRLKVLCDMERFTGWGALIFLFSSGRPHGGKPNNEAHFCASLPALS